jgi:peptide/nickel transport system substrate-binding protein
MRRHPVGAVRSILVVLALVVVAATAPAITPARAADPNTLVYAQISTGTSKIPAFTTTGEDTNIMAQIYDSLVQADAKTWKIGPDLASSYTVSPDGKTWTFVLHKGVKWQGGYGEFTCADVAFTWQFNKNPANSSFWKTQAGIVDSVSCPDPYTAVFHLATPFLGFIWNVANVEPSTGWVMSQAAWNKLGRAGYEKTPIGTGPYMLKSLTPGQDVMLARNPDYWGPKPAIENLDFKVIADSQTAALAVKSGAVDIVNTNDPVIAIEYQNTPGVQVLAKTALRTDYLEINTTVKPFDNVKLRQAMAYMIDYPGLVSAVLRGYGTAGYSGIVMPGMTGFDQSVNRLNTYDPPKARQLLSESGVKLPINGFFTTYNDTLDVNAAQFIAANLAQFGLNMEPRPLERGTLVQERIKPQTPASVLGTAVAPDPDGLFSLTFISANNPPAGLNIARYSGIDKLYDAQRAAATAAARDQILKQIQQRFTTDVPAIEYYILKETWLVSARVQNYEPFVLFGGDPLAQVTFK